MKRMKTVYAVITMIVLMLIATGCSSNGDGDIGVVEINPDLLFMTIIPQGTFRMGDTLDYTEWGSDQKPIHTVQLTYDYYIGIWEVTVREFMTFLNRAGVREDGYYHGKMIIDIEAETCEYYYAGDAFRLKHPGKVNHPVIEVTWWGAVEYCNWLSREMGINEAYNTTSGSLINSVGESTTDITEVEGYRLPTEAEWEHAARGAQNDYATDDDFAFSGGNTLNDVGWYSFNSGATAYPLGDDGKGTLERKSKAPNEIGLYDMSGNVWEWCNDYYQSNYYYESPVRNPTGPTDTPDDYRVIRGGSWFNTENFCRVAFRAYTYQNFGAFSIGFRVAKTK